MEFDLQPVDEAMPSDFDLQPVEEQEEKKKNSRLQALARGAMQAVTPTLTGYGGMRAGAMVPGGPLAKTAGMLLGGIGGSIAGSVAQNKTIEELFPSYAEMLAEDRRDYPVMQALGNVAGSLVANKLPSKESLGALASGARSLLGAEKPVMDTLKALPDAQKAALLNVAAGAGLGGAMEAWQAIDRNEEGKLRLNLSKIDPGAAFVNIAGNAFLTNPNRLGEAIAGGALRSPVGLLGDEKIKVQAPEGIGEIPPYRVYSPGELKKVNETQQSKGLVVDLENPSVEGAYTQGRVSEALAGKKLLLENGWPEPPKKVTSTDKDVLKKAELERRKALSIIRKQENKAKAENADVEVVKDVSRLKPEPSSLGPEFDLIPATAEDIRRMEAKPGAVKEAIKAQESEAVSSETKLATPVEGNIRERITYEQEKVQEPQAVEPGKIVPVEARQLKTMPKAEPPEIFGGKMNQPAEAVEADVVSGRTLKIKLGNQAESGGGKIPSIISGGWKNISGQENLPFLASNVSRLKEYGPTGKAASKILNNFFVKLRENKGKFATMLKLPSTKLSKEENTQLSEYLYAKQYGLPTEIILSAKQEKVANAYREAIKNVRLEQNKKGIKVRAFDAQGKEFLREGRIDPNYFPGITDSKVIDIVVNGKTSPEKQRLIQDWIDHQVKFSEGKLDANTAKQRIEEFIRSMGSGDADVRYNAIRKMEGYGIPWSWQEKNFSRLLERYGNRVARDFAYFDSIETNPEALAMFGIKPTAGTGVEPAKKLASGEAIGLLPQDLMQSIMRHVRGDFTKTEAIVSAANGVIVRSMLGIPGGIRDYLSNAAISMQYSKVTQWPLYLKAHLGIRNGIMAGYRQGTIAKRIVDITDPVYGLSTTADMLNGVAEFITKYGGREWLEKGTRGLDMAYFQMVALSNLASKNTKWLNKFGELGGIDPKEWQPFLGKSAGEIPPELAERFAAAATERVQGTYDARRLPEWTTTSPVSPFFWLARWSIERANNFYEDVAQPAMNGDLAPLMKATVGMLVGGAGMVSAWEKLFGKKQQEATQKEIRYANITDTEKRIALTHQLAFLVSFSGMSGMLGDTLYSISKLMRGKESFGYQFPLMDFYTQTVWKGMVNLAEAVKQGEPPVEAFGRFLGDAAVKNIQTLRMLAQWTVKKDDVERSNMLRDLRVFEELNGYPTGGSGKVDFNPLVGMKARDFRRARTDEEAAEALPGALLEAVNRSGGKPEVVDQKLEALQRVPTEGWPDLESDEAADYFLYLVKTQGKDAAIASLEENMRMRELNKRKSEEVRSYR